MLLFDHSIPFFTRHSFHNDPLHLEAFIALYLAIPQYKKIAVHNMSGAEVSENLLKGFEI